MNQSPNKNYFTMPNEIFSLGLDASEIAVYAYLRCLENRRTYQCWPSYTTIGNAVGRAKNTVMRYVDALAEKGLVSTEPTEATEMFHILKNAENPHFYGFRLHTFRTTDKVIRYGINNQFDFAEHPAVIQRGEKRTINICVAVPAVA